MPSASDLSQLREVGGLSDSICGPALAAAATLAPTHKIHHITGTTEISTITPPFTGFKGTLIFIPDAAFTTSTGGNIAVVCTGVTNRPLHITYDGSTWYPHSIT